MDRFIGKMLDNRYEILEVIGNGGMAMVYKAKCHRLNRYVAIKILKDEYASDAEFSARFSEEARSVAMLSHINIVSVYDVSSTGDLEYIVMELIDGITLKEYLSRRGPLTWREVTYFSMQIARALEHAHSRGIIHRDIKPQNIMLLRDGTVKVADFGIARKMEAPRTSKISEAIGSVHYVSPEQAKGSDIDCRSDLYSFGVVMYEMLTGRLPFEGDNAIQIALQHINSIPLNPSDHIPDIPRALEQITMKAMCANLNRRYTSATEIMADLECFKNDPSFELIIPGDVDIPSTIPGESATKQLRDIAAEKEDRTRTDGGRRSEAGRRTDGGRKHVEKPHRASSHKKKQPEQKRRKKNSSKMPAAMLFSALAIIIFFVGAIYFVTKIIDPFGTNTSESITVPHLVGYSLEEVLLNEENDVFKIVTGEEIYDDTVAAGYIISQSPLPGRNASEGDTITVAVSLGPRTVTLSKLEGMDYRAAESLLSRQNIHYIEKTEYSEDIPKDMIIRTTPEEGAVLNAGDSVIIYISLGSEPIIGAMPSLIGLTEAEARTALTEAGLNCGFVTQVDHEGEPGLVVFQSIPAESEVELGTTVDINISRLPGSGDLPVTTTAPPPVTTTTTQYLGDRAILFTVALTGKPDANGYIKVDIYVNDELQYSQYHTPEEMQIAVTLTGSPGEKSIKVFQNKEITDNEYRVFE